MSVVGVAASCSDCVRLTASVLAWWGGSPTFSPFPRGRGLGFGKDAEIERPKALQDAKPTKRSYRDREFTACFIKIDFFYNLKRPLMLQSVEKPI